MTVPANSRRREYQGNGVTTVFNGPMAYSKSNVLAWLIEGSVATLVPMANYEVSRFGNENGTVVTMATAPTANQALLLLRVMPYTQDVDVTNQGAFHAETIEKGYDAIVMQIQQLVDSSLELVFENGEFVWDAKGSRIVRVGDAKLDMDAINLRTLYLEIERVISGGGVQVNPRYWEFTGNGGDTDFELPGADVSDLLFYDVVLEGLSKEPYDGYNIVPAAGGGYAVRFLTAPADGAEGFVILRGYAKPSGGDGNPITSLRIPIIDVPGTTYTVDLSSEYALLRTTNASPCLLTVRTNIGDQFDMRDGSFFSVAQRGPGQARLVADTDVQLVVPPGFLPYTRSHNSVIHATCEYADGNVWLISGDLAEA